MLDLNIVLVEPEIPQNAGNIARTCAVTGCALHMIRPFGFEISDKHLKRAGLDYWKYLEIYYYDSIEEVMNKFFNGENFWFFSTKAQKIHADAKYKDGDFLVFGKETKGLDETLLRNHYDSALRIPMLGEIRSLNLSNSAAIVLFEALRQNDFEGFNEAGSLTDFSSIAAIWKNDVAKNVVFRKKGKRIPPEFDNLPCCCYNYYVRRESMANDR